MRHFFKTLGRFKDEDINFYSSQDAKGFLREDKLTVEQVSKAEKLLEKDAPHQS